MKIKKPCLYPRCPNLTENVYCPQHSRVQQEYKAESDKQYDKYKRDAKSAGFYASKAWKELRAVVFRKQYGLCQRCMARNNFTRGHVVDHKIPIKVDWNKRLDEDNLQVLCHKCHNKKTREER